MHIERRVGAHNHGIKIVQSSLHFILRFEPFVVVVVFRADKLERRGLGHHFAVLHGEFAGKGVVQFVPALGGFAHHGVGGVFVGFESGQRVGDEEDVHGVSLWEFFGWRGSDYLNYLRPMP